MDYFKKYQYYKRISDVYESELQEKNRYIKELETDIEILRNRISDYENSDRQSLYNELENLRINLMVHHMINDVTDEIKSINTIKNFLIDSEEDSDEH